MPLQSLPSHMGSRRSWLPGSQNSNMHKLGDEEDAEHASDGGSSQVNLWAGKPGGIVKTTNIQVSRSEVPAAERSGRNDGPGQGF